jgi:hypothetical protein
VPAEVFNSSPFHGFVPSSRVKSFDRPVSVSKNEVLVFTLSALEDIERGVIQTDVQFFSILHLVGK